MSSDKAAGRVLLPQDAIPSHYKLKLSCDLERFIFDGEESISLEVLAPTSSITLHAKEILFKTAHFEAADGKKLELVSMSQDIDLQTMTLVFSEPLPLGKGGKVCIEYQGSHNNQMAGFYRSGYTDINGEKKVMVSTQFESLDARRCFPCWDEPAMKATFEVALEVPVHMTAFSNMPETKSTYLPKGRKLIEYATSPQMSTYLLAFIVGEFDFIQSTTGNGVAVRVFTPPGKAKDGEFALDCACKCLDIYDEFFQVPYPLPKLDMVAIPEFAMGAMENWGAVTYREVDLLIDSKKASAQQKQRVATVVAHELAHQWFGNLVTMQWWDDLWLNEGFASWTENYATNLIYPDYKMWEQFTYTKQTAALNLDSLRSSHPIQVPIKHAREVEEVFDAISYCKGSCVVRMIYAVLGHQDFQAGLQLYMDRHQYSNTETYHLWGAWTEVSGKPIGEMMKTWTEQMGFPMVIVESCDSSTPGKMTLNLKQVWFLADGSLKAEEESKLWTIPLICGTTSDKEKGRFVSFMNEKTASVTIDMKDSPDSWLKLNYNQESPFRVLYTPDLLAKLAIGVASKSLPPADRAGLLLDTFAIVKAGQFVGGSYLLRLLKAYRNEDNSTVWDVIAMVLGSLSSVLKTDEQLTSKFESFASSIVLPAFQAVGWSPKPEDGHLDKMKRSTLVALLSSFCWKDDDIISEARKRFDAFIVDPSDTKNLPSDYKTSVFAMILKAGGENEFTQMKDICKTAESTVEKKAVYNSIGAVQDVTLKRKALDWTNSEVKLQDFFYTIGSVSSSSYAGLELTWSYFKENFEMYKTKLSSASASLMDAVIIYSCGSYASEERAGDIEDFFKANPMPQNARKIAQTVEKIRVNASFYNRLVSDEEFIKELE